jgi:hypothetical protein
VAGARGASAARVCKAIAPWLIAGSEAAVNQRLKQDTRRPARNERAPKLGKAFADCRPSHAWTPAAIAAELFDMNTNFGVMSATYPVF